jgi:hypothetical protein
MLRRTRQGDRETRRQGEGRGLHRFSLSPPLLVSLSILIATAQIATAADVLQQVPRDALGFAVVRDLGRFDARATKLMGAAQVALPGPLLLVRTATGIGDGLDPARDALLVLLPPQNNSEQFHLAMWLPVRDYDALVRSLEGDPSRRIAGVTVAGEDLLAVRHGDWAVLAGPDQRDRLEMLHDKEPSPPRQVGEWQTWIESNDATLVVLPAGMKLAWTWASQTSADRRRAAGVTDAGDPTRPNRRAQAQSSWEAAQDWLAFTLETMPALGQWFQNAESGACGFQLDDAGGAVVSTRLSFAEGVLPPATTSPVTPPRLFEGGAFIFDAFGSSNKQWAVPAVRPYVRGMASDLATQFGIALTEAELAPFQATVEQAVAEVDAFATLTLPGTKDEGVFTNSFLAVRAPSSEQFLVHANKAMGIWNDLLSNAKGDVKLTFEKQAVTIAGHAGTEYSIDMVTAIGGPPLPAIRDVQEKLFGPGARFRVQLVNIDANTALLAIATETQVAKLIPVLAKTPAGSAEIAELRGIAKSLRDDAAWQAYFSPPGYYSWFKRQMDAMAGDVIGGPLVKDFPASPPLGAAGGVDRNVVWAEVAVSADTLRHAGVYFRD